MPEDSIEKTQTRIRTGGLRGDEAVAVALLEVARAIDGLAEATRARER